MIAIVSSGNGLPLNPADEGPGGPESDRRGGVCCGEVEIESR